jgi:hypothetical protein
MVVVVVVVQTPEMEARAHRQQQQQQRPGFRRPTSRSRLTRRGQKRVVVVWW